MYTNPVYNVNQDYRIRPVGRPVGFGFPGAGLGLGFLGGVATGALLTPGVGYGYGYPYPPVYPPYVYGGPYYY